MLEMDGPSLHSEVMSQFPLYQDKFIFITGAAKGGDVSMVFRNTQCLGLNKPITKHHLLSIVDQFTHSLALNHEAHLTYYHASILLPLPNDTVKHRKLS